MNQYLTEQSILYLQQLQQPPSDAAETPRKGVPFVFRRWMASIRSRLHFGGALKTKRAGCSHERSASPEI